MNNLKIIAGSSNPELTKSIARYLNQRLVDVTIKPFTDGETFVQINENVRGSDVYIVQSTNFPTNDNLMELLVMIDAAKRAAANRITAVIPFFGYARQDRKDKSRVPITAKLVANMLTVAGVNRVITMDLHSPSIQGFFDCPVDNLFAAPVLLDYLNTVSYPAMHEDTVIVSPDEGGIKRASFIADKFGIGFGFVAKSRLDENTVRTEHFVGNVENKNVLIVDDMSESLGTLINAAIVCKQNDARVIRAAITHGVLNEKACKFLYENGGEIPNIDKLIMTNTAKNSKYHEYLSNNESVVVLDVSPLFGEAIKRAHTGESISNLFT